MTDDMNDLPDIIVNALARRGLVAVSAKELERLRNPVRRDPDPSECPYELFPGKYGPSHDEYLGRILSRDGEPLSGLDVVRCSACQTVRLEPPIAMAGVAS